MKLEYGDKNTRSWYEINQQQLLFHQFTLYVKDDVKRLTLTGWLSGLHATAVALYASSSMLFGITPQEFL